MFSELNYGSEKKSSRARSLEHLLGNMVAAGPLDGHVSKGRSEYIVSNNKRKRKGTGLGERTPGNKISDAVKADARSALQLKRLKKETARCEVPAELCRCMREAATLKSEPARYETHAQLKYFCCAPHVTACPLRR